MPKQATKKHPKPLVCCEGRIFTGETVIKEGGKAFIWEVPYDGRGGLGIRGWIMGRRGQGDKRGIRRQMDGRPDGHARWDGEFGGINRGV